MGTIRESVCHPYLGQTASHGRPDGDGGTPTSDIWWFPTDGLGLLDRGLSACPSLVATSRPWYSAPARCSNSPVSITCRGVGDSAARGMDDRTVMEAGPASTRILFYNDETAGASGTRSRNKLTSIEGQRRRRGERHYFTAREWRREYHYFFRSIAFSSVSIEQQHAFF
jgi:hypothetical protein